MGGWVARGSPRAVRCVHPPLVSTIASAEERVPLHIIIHVRSFDALVQTIGPSKSCPPTSKVVLRPACVGKPAQDGGG